MLCCRAYGLRLLTRQSSGIRIALGYGLYHKQPVWATLDLGPGVGELGEV